LRKSHIKKCAGGRDPSGGSRQIGNGSIAIHEGPAEQGYVLYVISGTGKMTLNDKDGKQYGEINYKPDDILLFHPHTWHSWVNGDKPFEFLGFDMQEKK
jgi:oxalate decarboxylase/phosphoglucose isomerase-like protein (cupin superfamily)